MQEILRFLRDAVARQLTAGATLNAALGVALVLAANPAWAAAPVHGAGELQVQHPWTRATAPGATVAAGYLEIRNSGSVPDRLIGATTPAAEKIELHVLVRDGDVVRMRERKTFEVPARQRLTLSPGGSHLMIVGLRRPLVKGDRIPVTLRFERSGELQIELQVQPDESGKHHH